MLVILALLSSPPQPAGLRNCNAAAFASFKKYAAHFLNTDCVGTEPKDAAYAVTVLNSKQKWEDPSSDKKYLPSAIKIGQTKFYITFTCKEFYSFLANTTYT